MPKLQNTNFSQNDLISYNSTLSCLNCWVIRFNCGRLFSATSFTVLWTTFYSSLYVLFCTFCLAKEGVECPSSELFERHLDRVSDPFWAGDLQEVPSNLICSNTDTLHYIINNISHFNSKNAKAFSHFISSYYWNAFHQDTIQKNLAILGRVWIFFLPSQAAR